jgi:predicted NBD/HSP70 family sugar kinase
VVTQGVGRPSLMVSPADDVVAFSVNPDVDAITVGVVTFSGKVIHKIRQVTQVQPAATTAADVANDLITKLRAQLPAGTRIAGVGVAIPGQVRSADGVVRLAPHLNWVEVPFARMLNQLSGLPVFIDNDASLGSIAERDFGAGRGFKEIVYLFGSSGGIGGGVIHDGQPMRGAAGYAGELGHIRISDSLAEDYSGLSGTLESLVSRETLLAALKLNGVDDDELRAALAKDPPPKVRKVAEAQIDSLAIAIGNFVNIFNPEIILLAGYLSVLYAFDTDRLLSRFRWSSLTASQDRLIIRPAELGANLLMVGAAQMPFDRVVEEPATMTFLPARPGRK